MKNETQLERYKNLLSYLDTHFAEDINIEKVEKVSHYSYRNINRIFNALHHETIGKYIKRLRLEKAAQYLKYSPMSISDISFAIGFEDIAAFSKAFKSRYNCAPTAFRSTNEAHRQMTRNQLSENHLVQASSIPYEIEFIEEFDYLAYEYRGSYHDDEAIATAWTELIEYCIKNRSSTTTPLYLQRFWMMKRSARAFIVDMEWV